MGADPHGADRVRSLWRATAILLLCILTALEALLASPRPLPHAGAPRLEEVIPEVLGEWRVVRSPQVPMSVSPDTRGLADALYDQVLMRTYADPQGERIMLAVAYAAAQRQEVKIHQPEVCYTAQGFRLLAVSPHPFDTTVVTRPAGGKRLIFRKHDRIEAVSYWIRLGQEYPQTGFQMRLHMLADGLLRGRIDDGVLVRVSSIVDDETMASAAYVSHDRFLHLLTAATEATAPGLLVTSAPPHAQRSALDRKVASSN